MKKITLLFIIFLFISCSNNEDSSLSTDPIIGIWKPYKEFVDNVEIPLDECREMDRFTFKEDGSFEGIFYDNDGNGSCLEDVESYYNIQWEKSSGNTYIFTYNDGETETDEIFFEENTFYIEYSDAIDPLNLVFATYREVYIRVQ